MLETLFSGILIAQYIAPRSINRTTPSHTAAFYVEVGNPTKQPGKFYVDPVSVAENGTPSFELEQEVNLSVRVVSIAPGRTRRINGIAKVNSSVRSFFICTSPVQTTILNEGTSTTPALGVRTRACSHITIKRLIN